MALPVAAELFFAACILSSGSRCAKRLYICKIDVPSCCELGEDQIFPGDEGDSQIAGWIDQDFDPVRPCMIEVHPIDSGKDFDHDRGYAHAKECVRLHQVFGLQIEDRSAELGESSVNCLSIFDIGAND